MVRSGGLIVGTAPRTTRSERSRGSPWSRWPARTAGAERLRGSTRSVLRPRTAGTGRWQRIPRLRRTGRIPDRPRSLRARLSSWSRPARFEWPAGSGLTEWRRRFSRARRLTWIARLTRSARSRGLAGSAHAGLPETTRPGRGRAARAGGTARCGRLARPGRGVRWQRARALRLGGGRETWWWERVSRLRTDRSGLRARGISGRCLAVAVARLPGVAGRIVLRGRSARSRRTARRSRMSRSLRGIRLLSILRRHWWLPLSSGSPGLVGAIGRHHVPRLCHAARRRRARRFRGRTGFRGAASRLIWRIHGAGSPGRSMLSPNSLRVGDPMPLRFPRGHGE